MLAPIRSAPHAPTAPRVCPPSPSASVVSLRSRCSHVRAHQDDSSCSPTFTFKKDSHRHVSGGDDRLALSRAIVVGALSSALVVGAVTTPFQALADSEGPPPIEVPYTPYEVQKESKEDAVALAKALKELPAGTVKGYGAFWCEGCNKQKDVLGKQAVDILFESGVYVECFPEGVRKNVPGKEDITKPAAVCNGFDKPGWPLWVVNDPQSGKELRRITGVKTTEQLENALIGSGGVVGDVLSGAKSLVDRNLISGERMF